MHKVLILSYYFPPCNLTGAARVGQWYDHLYKYDIYPIVVTRKWEGNITSFNDIFLKSSPNKKKISDNRGEVHYLPFSGTTKDKITRILRIEKFTYLTRLLSLFGLIFQNISIKLSPYYFLYKEAHELLERDNEISSVIISGKPFQQFFIGYKLKKKFPKINWIPDYRDEWTSRPNFENFKSSSLLNFIDKFFEKKWLSNSYKFIYVNDYYLARIEKVNQKRGVTIENGFKKRSQVIRKTSLNQLVLTFSGTLYAHQDLSLFVDGVKKFREENLDVELKILFLGSKINKNSEKFILECFSDIEETIEITDRLSKEDLEAYYEKTDAFLMFPIKNMSGVVPTKVLNYLPLGIPILFCPTDNGAIHSLIDETKSGYNISTQVQLVKVLYLLLKQKKSSIKNVSVNIEQFSTDFRVNKLADFLTSIS